MSSCSEKRFPQKGLVHEANLKAFGLVFDYGEGSRENGGNFTRAIIDLEVFGTPAMNDQYSLFLIFSYNLLDTME